MVINVYQEGKEEYIKQNEIFSETDNNSEIQKIKSHLDITYLKYVSDNIKNLLKIDIINNKACFERTDKSLKNTRKNGMLQGYIIYSFISRRW